MNIKRVISGILASSMILCSLASCGNNQKQSNDTTKAGVNSNEKITVKILKPKGASEVSMDQMDILKVMGEKFNIDFKFDNPPANDYAERLNLIMMEKELPDVIMSIPMTDIVKHINSGVILSLNDLIKNQMPNLTAAFKKFDGVEKELTKSDGKIYYFPVISECISGNQPYIVRTDWLKKLNIKSPVTIQDWEKYWELVKKTDLNGNGKNDEIPFSSMMMDDLRNFCTAWGVVDDFYSDPDDGGKIHYGPIEDKYKQAIVWLNSMWKKGYIDSELVTMDESGFSARLSQNVVASYRGYFGGQLAAQNAKMPETVPGFRLDGTVPPKGPTGIQIHTAIDKNPIPVVGAVITTSCKNPERVAQWIDYLYSDEGVLLMNMGIEGKHYNMVNGYPKLTDFVMKNPDGLSPKQATGTYTFLGTGPCIANKALVDQIDDAAVVKAKNECIIPFLEQSNKYIITNKVSFTSEQDSTKQSIMADIDTYVDEMIMKFITGKEPIENWDQYVSKVKSMRIDDAIKIHEEALAAWQK